MFLRRIIILIILIFFHTHAFAKETLIFAIDIIRHGDRTPLLVIPKATYKWQEGRGQLTARGLQQTWLLGTSFRKKYVTKYHLLPKHYEDGTMLVFSTDRSRSFMSAQAVLHGLYPLDTGILLLPFGRVGSPSNFHPIPIHIRVNSTAADKAEYKRLAERYVAVTPEWIIKTKQLENKFQKWSQATGLKISTIRQLKSLGNTLSIYNIHHVPIPSGLSKNDVEEITAIGRWARRTENKTKEVANFFAQPMLATVANYFYEASQQKKPLKYVLFSDHDTMISSIMTMLENPLDGSPPYAADLNFSLFKTDTGDYRVEIKYIGKPVIVHSCGNDRCTLQQFIKLSA